MNALRVLVTGSSGRMGRWLATGLVEQGHRVIGVDRVARGLRDVDEHELDLDDATATAHLISDLAPDAVVHLAGIALPFSVPERELFDTNVRISRNVLDAAESVGIARVLAASSPTVIGYGTPGWSPAFLPIDEDHPVAPSHAYALSKVVLEETVRMYARTSEGAWGFFRPCYAITPGEWLGEPTQLGHTVADRLADPALAAVSLFNYLDTRELASFVSAWLAAPADAVNGQGFFVGAPDALAARPVAELWRTYAPSLGAAADALTGRRPVFSGAKAERILGWRARRTWHEELTPAEATMHRG